MKSMPYTIIFILFLNLCLINGGAQATQQTRVLMYGTDAGHTGVYQTKALEKFHQLKYKFKTTGNASGIPMIRKGTVYFGSSKGYLYAVNAKTGTAVWTFNAGKKLYHGPTIAGDTAYLG